MVGCKNCGTTTGIGNTNSTQRAATNGNVPAINTFGQPSELRPANYWVGMMRPALPDIARRPSGYWAQPSRDCLCNLACLRYQKTDTPTPARQVRAIMLPQNFTWNH